MIHVDRKRVPKPDFWNRPDFRQFLRGWARFRGAEGGTRGTQRRMSPPKELERFRRSALATLLAAFQGKCAYSEEKLEPSNAEIVFHRPEADSVGLISEISPHHYWWLVGDWSNWLPASRAVRLAKGTDFPVAGERSPLPPGGRMPTARWMERHRDPGLLLDPGRDFPSWYLEFGEDGSIHARSHPSPGVQARFKGHSRGEIAIKVLDLNNRRLRAARAHALRDHKPRLEGGLTDGVEGSQDWLSGLDPGQAFATAVRQRYARAFLASLADRSRPFSSPMVQKLLRELAEELGAEIAIHGVPWTSSPIGLDAWRPARKVVGREWPELDEEGWRRLIEGQPHVRSISAVPPPVSHLESPRIIERSARVAEIRIRNFKAIEEASLDLSQEPVTLPPRYGTADETLLAAGWIALLGENGSGKSCFLQAVGLALAGDQLPDLLDERQLTWKRMLRRGSSQGRVFLRFTGDATIDLRFNAQRHWWVGGAPQLATFVRGYGATRLLEGAPTSDSGALAHVRLANLFDPRAPVLDAEEWLLGLDEGDFQVVALALGGFLGDDRSSPQLPPGNDAAQLPLLTRDLERREVLVGGDPLATVSDGFRAIISMVCDIVAGLGVGLSDMRNAQGIVLVDELGSHLHPRWKMEITGRLRRELPNLQFLVSTHEPLCLRGLIGGEVIRIRKTRPTRGEDSSLAPGVVTLERTERSPSDYRVDQLLTSEFFGLDTTVDPDLDLRFQAYYRLLAMTPDERAEKGFDEELDRLRADLQNRTRPVLGFTRRDQLVYEAIDQFLKDQEALSPPERQARRAQTLQRVQDIWRTREALGAPGARR